MDLRVQSLREFKASFESSQYGRVAGAIAPPNLARSLAAVIKYRRAGSALGFVGESWSTFGRVEPA
ncbi:hypothetical protein [Leptolyngbya iicbica]|uniref:Uncharacterized protein n=2 Tax=Cyanophyceae TaxID=3028117 RepID=A0A4V2E1X0_9CYAN|nr:hypothetical protein [Leptolyngbya sp. LK]RZM75604.1 hypothetical protein DYY88_20075 [Leptolyngbya sp. LK]